MKNFQTTLWGIAFACLAVSQAAAQQRPLNPVNTWVIADFNGDSTPDLVTLNALNGAEPEIQTGGTVATVRLSWHAFPMQRLRARDLDGDSDQDLVLESLTSVAIAVWINDGSGHFTRADLNDFRPQLCHGDSRECRAVAVPSGSEITDEAPGSHDAASAPEIALPRFCVDVVPAFSENPRTLFVSGIGSRGPPLSPLN